MNKVSIGVLALVVGVIIGAATVKNLTPVVPTMPTENVGGVTVDEETFEGLVTAKDELRVEDGSGTTTLKIVSNTAGRGACIETYGTSSATKIAVEFMVATTTVSYAGKNGLVTWRYGSCE